MVNTSNESLTLHMMIHKGERPHKDYFFGNVFLTKGEWNDHQWMHTRDKLYHIIIWSKHCHGGTRGPRLGNPPIEFIFITPCVKVTVAWTHHSPYINTKPKLWRTERGTVYPLIQLSNRTWCKAENQNQTVKKWNVRVKASQIKDSTGKERTKLPCLFWHQEKQ